MEFQWHWYLILQCVGMSERDILIILEERKRWEKEIDENINVAFLPLCVQVCDAVLCTTWAQLEVLSQTTRMLCCTPCLPIKVPPSSWFVQIKGALEQKRDNRYLSNRFSRKYSNPKLQHFNIITDVIRLTLTYLTHRNRRFELLSITTIKLNLFSLSEKVSQTKGSKA